MLFVKKNKQTNKQTKRIQGFNEEANRILEGSSGYKNSKNIHISASGSKFLA